MKIQAGLEAHSPGASSVSLPHMQARGDCTEESLEAHNKDIYTGTQGVLSSREVGEDLPQRGPRTCQNHPFLRVFLVLSFSEVSPIPAPSLHCWAGSRSVCLQIFRTGPRCHPDHSKPRHSRGESSELPVPFLAHQVTASTLRQGPSRTIFPV